MTENVYEKVKCVGKKWFLKFPYKVIETDATFFENAVEFRQGSGFALVNDGKKVSTKISYASIQDVNCQTKFSTPNVVAAIAIGILAIITGIIGLAPIAGVLGVMVVAIPIMLFLGRTAVASVQFVQNGASASYEIPFEFKAEAESLAEKINSRR